MKNITFPSTAEVKPLFTELENGIISDIKTAVHDALYSRIDVDWSMIDYQFLFDTYAALVFWEQQRDQKLNQKPNQKGSQKEQAVLYTYIGPEMFRWLGMFSHRVRRSIVSEYTHLLTELPKLVLPRILPYAAKLQEPLVLPIMQPGSGKGIVFPQLSEALLPDFAHNGLVTVTINAEDCLFENGQESSASLSHKEILALLDGHGNDTVYFDNLELPVYLHQNGFLLREMVEELNEAASQPINSNEELTVLRFCDLKKNPYPGIIKNLSEGFNYIKKNSETLFDETLVSIKGITLVKGNRYVGSSDIWYHGIAVLNPDDTWTEITFADHIIHESAHTILHALNELTPVLYNPFEVNSYSPIRPDPRPVYGTLHATYVFMRLSQFFVDVSRADTSEEVMFRLNRHIKGFYDGMKVLAEYAAFTDAGYELFKDMTTYYNQLIKDYPDPAPEKYQNASRDYVI